MSKLFNFEQVKGKWHKFPSFNLKGGAKLYKNFAQKLLAVSLCMAMVLLGVPLGGHGVHVAAADDEATIPNTMFLTKEALLALCEETNSGTGLLATGTGTDVKLRINFGQRPEAAVYYKNFDGASDTADAGPTTWLVAGSENFTPEGGEETDGLVLYSEEPLVSAYNLRDASSKMNSKFQPTYTNKIDNQYWVGSGTDKTDRGDSDWGAYPAADPDGTPDNPDYVYANHWGASNLRQVLAAIYNGSTLGTGAAAADYSGFFSAPEKGLMAVSEIRTNDHQTGSAVEYTTRDVLYAPRYDTSKVVDSVWTDDTRITVGAADSLSVDSAHWGGLHWLRSPVPGTSSVQLVALPGDVVDSDAASSQGGSVSAAFRLNLSSVLFTSAASAASSAEGGEKFSKIAAGTPMTLRVNKYCGGTATLSEDRKSITVKNAAAGDVLMVQGVTDAGENWSYSKKLTGAATGTVTASDVMTACSTTITGFALSVFSKCNIWLERTTGEPGGTVTYASTPIVAGAPASTSHAGCTLEAVPSTATCTEPGHQAHYKCSVCGQLFSDEDGLIPIDDPEEIPAHGLTHVKEKAATCTEAGHKEYWQCNDTTCNKLFSDATGTTPIDEPTELPATGHSITTVTRQDAACTEPGREAHYKCSVCGQLFSDEEGKSPIDEPTELPAPGHDWGNWTTTKEPTCTEAGSKTRTCKHDSSHTETEAIAATGHNSSGAWQKDETHHWKVCGTCSDKLETAEHTWDSGTVTTQPTTSAPGVKTYKCSVCGQTKTETIPKLDAETGGGDDLPDFRPNGTTDPATWGSAVTRGDIPHWVSSDGTTSVQVPADNGIIWLKEDSDGTSAWYGLDNSAGVFAEGSRFWVRWLSKKSDPTLWRYYYDKFDTEHKTDVESDNLWIFLIGVTAPDGTEYTDFGTEVPLYIQKGPDWDGNDIRSVFISGASDEVLLSHFHGTMDYPESALHPAAEFYKIMLSHFSPYAIFDELTDEEKAALGSTGTGDISTELLISGLAIVLVSSLGVMLRLITSKRKFEE